MVRALGVDGQRRAPREGCRGAEGVLDVALVWRRGGRRCQAEEERARRANTLLMSEGACKSVAKHFLRSSPADEHTASMVRCATYDDQLKPIGHTRETG